MTIKPKRQPQKHFRRLPPLDLGNKPKRKWHKCEVCKREMGNRNAAYGDKGICTACVKVGWTFDKYGSVINRHAPPKDVR